MKTTLLIIAIAGILSLACEAQSYKQLSQFENNLIIATGAGHNLTVAHNNILIGKHAGGNITKGKYIIIIGDHSKKDTTKYSDYDINIDWNWGFFGTHEGGELKGYLRAWQRSFKFSGGGEAFTIARQEHIDELREYIISYWLDRIVNYYRIK